MDLLALQQQKQMLTQLLEKQKQVCDMMIDMMVAIT